MKVSINVEGPLGDRQVQTQRLANGDLVVTIPAPLAEEVDLTVTQRNPHFPGSRPHPPPPDPLE